MVFLIACYMLIVDTTEDNEPRTLGGYIITEVYPPLRDGFANNGRIQPILTSTNEKRIDIREQFAMLNLLLGKGKTALMCFYEALKAENPQMPTPSQTPMFTPVPTPITPLTPTLTPTPNPALTPVPTLIPTQTQAFALDSNMLPTPIPTLAQIFAPVPCSCKESLYNCCDFRTRDEAQKCYAHCLALTGNDVHQLMPNANWYVCTSYTSWPCDGPRRLG